MRFSALPLAASVVLLAAPAFAQVPGSTARPNVATPSANAPAYPQTPGPAEPNTAAPAENPPSNMRVSLDTQQRLKQSLQQNGFEDVTIMPQSYIIRAKAPDGARIVMLVGPDQMRGVMMGAGSSAQPSPSMQNGSSAPHQNGSSIPEQSGTNR